MASGTDEFAGTATGDTGSASPIDPATLAGSGTGGDDFDPAIHVGRDKRNADGSFTRKRGRKSGTGNASGSARQKDSNLTGATESLSRTLLMLHVGLASVSKAPEFEIDKAESDMLANATVNVLQEFDIRPDPKAEAIFGLIVACGTVYGPRVFLMRQRKAEESKQKSISEVVDFPGIGQHG